MSNKFVPDLLGAVNVQENAGQTGKHPVLGQLEALCQIASTDPERARDQGWKLLLDLGRRDDRAALHELWLAGDQPTSPPGRTVGKNLGLVHTTRRAWLQNLLAKRDPWTGKTIGATEGYNRLLLRALPIVKRLSSRRSPWFDGDEVAAFPFDVEFTDGAIEPRRPILAIIYGHPRHGNPSSGLFPCARIRDEVVELVDGLYVARVLLRAGDAYAHIGAFGLRRES